MAKINLSKKTLKEINEAVKEAESKTSGEIATAFIKESDNYAIYELTFAVICGFLYFTLLMFFSKPIGILIENKLWDYSVDHLLIFFGFSTFLVISLFYLLANFSFIDRLIVPQSVMRRKVNERAVRYFMESGVYNTKDRTGILIFISALERRVELLADRGISEKIPREKWDGIVRNITAGINKNKLAEHLSQSIRECGDLLAEHFPIQPDDINELGDDIAVLEK
jgi:putative membrane protein